MVNYVYDNKAWTWCDGLDAQLGTAYVPEPVAVVETPAKVTTPGATTTTTTTTTTGGGGGGGNPATANPAAPASGKARPAGGKNHGDAPAAARRR